MRILLILVDGMRPDALGELPQVRRMMQNAAYTLRAETVMPSVTLPCHMSLFHSVDPARHGTTTNTYAPQVRPVQGLCDLLAAHGKKSAFFYNWEELRDLSRPGSLAYSCFCSGHDVGYEQANAVVTDAAISYLTGTYTDFAFLYLGYVDAAGHQYGWMSEGYHKALVNSWEHIERIVAALPEDYTVMVTADHGGHDRTHGTALPEDMTIPLFLMGKEFTPGEELERANIKDIAPTVASLLGISPDKDWEGSCLANCSGKNPV